jgi:bifunctional non-homologous end joining protein LigD
VDEILGWVPSLITMTKHLKPMLATLVDKSFDAKGWLFEIKWDGFRAIAEANGNKVELYSRNLLSFNGRFPTIIKSLQGRNVKAIFDGEIVVVDKKGKSHFQLLQNYLENQTGQLTYYVFDILFLNGKDLRKLPLIERKKLLKKTLPKSVHIKYSDHVLEHGKKFYEIAKKQDLEGMIAKDIQSPYRSGQRTMEWQKIKIHKQQEAVIAGFTQPKGSRKKFGALVLGVYQRGKLVYIGHTGSGFNDKNLNLIYNKLRSITIPSSPFALPPKTNAPVTWVKPKLVCEVKFEEWTNDGHMRQPIFLGLRVDKKTNEVKREIPNDK